MGHGKRLLYDAVMRVQQFSHRGPLVHFLLQRGQLLQALQICDDPSRIGTQKAHRQALGEPSVSAEAWAPRELLRILPWPLFLTRLGIEQVENWLTTGI